MRNVLTGLLWSSPYLLASAIYLGVPYWQSGRVVCPPGVAGVLLLTGIAVGHAVTQARSQKESQEWDAMHNTLSLKLAEQQVELATLRAAAKILSIPSTGCPPCPNPTTSSATVSPPAAPSPMNPTCCAPGE